MALISCEECRAPVSDQALHCPKCGCPLSIIESSSWRDDVGNRVKLVLFGLGILSVAILLFSVRPFSLPLLASSLRKLSVQPEIVAHGCDDSSSRLFEYSALVWAEVENVGAEGVVTFEARVLTQDSTVIGTRTGRERLAKGQKARFEFTFDEVKLSDDDLKCVVRAY